jgi:hypothetical protein
MNEESFSELPLGDRVVVCISVSIDGDGKCGVALSYISKLPELGSCQDKRDQS